MNLTVISGAVSEVKTWTTLDNATNLNHKLSFRIGNKPVFIIAPINIAHGDVVTAAGYQGNEFDTIALRNDTTNTIYTVPEPPASTGKFIIVYIIGVLTLPILIGIFFIGCGWWAQSKINKRRAEISAAKKLLESTPPARK